MKISLSLKQKKKFSQLISFSLALTRSHRSQTSPRRYLSVLTSTTQPPKLSKSSETKKTRRRPITFSSFLLQTLKRRSLQSPSPFLCLSFRNLPQVKTGPNQAIDSSSMTLSKNPNKTILCSTKTSSTTTPFKGFHPTIPQSSSSTTPKSAARLSTDPNPLTT